MAPLLGVLLFGILFVIAMLAFLLVGIGGLFCLMKGRKGRSRFLKITGGILLIGFKSRNSLQPK